MFLAFKLSFVVDILAFSDFLGYSLKNLVNFFSNLLVTLVPAKKTNILIQAYYCPASSLPLSLSQAKLVHMGRLWPDY